MEYFVFGTYEITLEAYANRQIALLAYLPTRCRISTIVTWSSRHFVHATWPLSSLCGVNKPSSKIMSNLAFSDTSRASQYSMRALDANAVLNEGTHLYILVCKALFCTYLAKLLKFIHRSR